jgi:TPP-dependent pyruvate/acetoin dehydrogenase alpha subunit
MHGNKQVYKEAFERARQGKSRTLLERVLFHFKDHYTQQSREEGERDGLRAREQAQASGAGGASEAVH